MKCHILLWASLNSESKDPPISNPDSPKPHTQSDAFTHIFLGYIAEIAGLTTTARRCRLCHSFPIKFLHHKAWHTHLVLPYITTYKRRRISVFFAYSIIPKAMIMNGSDHIYVWQKRGTIKSPG